MLGNFEEEKDTNSFSSQLKKKNLTGFMNLEEKFTKRSKGTVGHSVFGLHFSSVEDD